MLTRLINYSRWRRKCRRTTKWVPQKVTLEYHRNPKIMCCVLLMSNTIIFLFWGQNALKKAQMTQSACTCMTAFRKKDCVIWRLRQHFHTTFSLNSPTFISTFLEEGRAYSLVPYYVILDSKCSKEYKQNKSYIVNVEVHS